MFLMKRDGSLLYATVLLLCLGCCKSSDLKRLTEDLLREYNVDVRPVDNPKNTTLVHLEMYPLHVTELDERRGILTLEVFVLVLWKDDYLNWKPEEYSGITEVHIDEKRLWKPDIIPHERRGDVDHHWLPVKLIVNSTGHVLWLTTASLELVCGSLDYSEYPEDTQRCVLTLSSWVCNIKDIDIVITMEKNDSYGHSDPANPNWLIKNMTFQRVETYYEDLPVPFAEAKFTMYLKRFNSPMRYLSGVPSTVPRLLTLFIFLTSDPTRKVIFACTSLLLGAILAFTILREVPSAASLPVALSNVNSAMVLCVSVVIVELGIMAVRNCKLRVPSFVTNLSASPFCQLFGFRTSATAKRHDEAKEELQPPNHNLGNDWNLVATILETIAFAFFAILLLAL